MPSPSLFEEFQVRMIGPLVRGICLIIDGSVNGSRDVDARGSSLFKYLLKKYSQKKLEDCKQMAYGGEMELI
jgi:hypothetical protein